MAKRSKRLELVKELAERRKKQADQMLAASRNRVSQDEHGLQQLQSFLLDYQTEFIAAGQQTIDPRGVQTRQAFLNKITHTIMKHRESMQHNRQELEAVEMHWKKSYAGLKAMDVLHEKAVNQERLEQDKQLQKELDERSQLRKPDFL